MSEFHFHGHPEIPSLPIPVDAGNVQTSIADYGATVIYDTPQGEADLVFVFGAESYGWQGEFMAKNGVTEFSNPDGTFTAEGSYYNDARGQTGGDFGDGVSVSGGDLLFPDFSSSATEASMMATHIADLSSSLMKAATADLLHA